MKICRTICYVDYTQHIYIIRSTQESWWWCKFGLQRLRKNKRARVAELKKFTPRFNTRAENYYSSTCATRETSGSHRTY